MSSPGEPTADDGTTSAQNLISASPENLTAPSASDSEEYTSSEEEDTDTDEEEEDEEPALKYERLNSVADLLKNTKDSASALVISGKNMVRSTLLLRVLPRHSH